jgi:hypothetical protein
MGVIRIDIPKDMETAFERAFPDQDKAAAILRLIEIEIAKRTDDRSFGDLVDEVLHLRDEPPYFTDEDIRRAREELRQ